MMLIMINLMIFIILSYFCNGPKTPNYAAKIAILAS